MSILDDIFSQLNPSHIPQPPQPGGPLSGYGNATQSGYTAPSAPPVAPQTPQLGVPAQAPPPQPETPQTGAGGFLQRLLPQPGGFAGLLSNQDMQYARKRAIMSAGLSMLQNSGPADMQHPAPTTLQALGAAGQAGFNQFDQSMQGDLAAQTQGAGINKARAIEAVRQKWQGQGLPPNATPAQAEQYFSQMAGDYAAAGDTDTTGKLAEVIRGLRVRQGFGDKMQPMKLGNQWASFDPLDGTMKVIPGSTISESADEVADHQANQRLRTLSLQQAEDTHQDALDTSTGALFQHRNLQQIQKIQSLGQVSTLLDQADAGNTYATQALPGALAGVLDPKSRVGPSVLAKLSTYDPSLPGRAMQYIQQNWHGTIPQQDRQYIRQALQAQYQQESGGVIKDYNAITKNRPGVASYLGTPESFLNAGSLANPAQQPGAPAAGGNSAAVRALLGQ